MPKQLRGTVLYPLNLLRVILPDVYATEIRKYQGREFVMERRIPQLNCRWNDVLHLIAASPYEIAEAMSDAGLTLEARFYQIDPTLVSEPNTSVYLGDGNFAPFDPDSFTAYAQIPESTRTYYRQMKLEGRLPLLFRGIPHILFRGTLDISNCHTIYARTAATGNMEQT